MDHYENFPVATALLPRRMRRAVAAIYRFARSADDFADEGEHPPEWRLQQLHGFRAALDRVARADVPTDPLFHELAHVVEAHALPLAPFYALLSAFEQDVIQGRYATFGDVLSYCGRSANPVGRLLLHLFGVGDDLSARRSDAICTALQLANFWQDIQLDWRKNRVYIPQEDLLRFGVPEADIAERRVSEGFAACVKFQVERTRAMMLWGAPLSARVGGRCGYELRLVVEGGLRILEKVEHVGFDVFRRRPILRSGDWALMFLRSLTKRPPPAVPLGVSP